VIVARWLTLGWLLITLVALGWPADDLPESGIIGIDKVVHVLLFAAGTVLALHGWPDRPLTVIVALLLFAPLAEVWQLILPTSRDANVPDAVANALGVVVGWLIWRLKWGR